MKITKQLILMTPLALLVAGCNVPVRPDTTISEWEREGQLPNLSPTGNEGERVYSETATYPLDDRPNIIVVADRRENRGSDLLLAEAIRKHVEYDRGLAPSLERVTISVCDDGVTLQGIVKSDFDARIIVDNLRDVDGVTLVKNDLEVNPNWY